jgi:hypothetical protein
MRFLLVGILALGLAASGVAADAPQRDQPEPKQDAARVANEEPVPPEPPTYRPPARGKPRARVAGGVRSVGGRLPRIRVLTPAHTGQTISSQPSLFWYLDRALPAGSRLVFTLVDDASVAPLVETPLETPVESGVQRIDLADHRVALVGGIEYEWSVVLVVDPEQRSLDVVSTGWIDRVEIPAGLAEDAPPSAHVYADHGLWYDALAAASDRLEADPGDPGARAGRDALLRQVGLDLAGAGE